MSLIDELQELPIEELEKIVHEGTNLHVPNSKASTAKRILESQRHKQLIEVKEQNLDTTETDSTIFYSWQSDLPNKTNRNFIEDAIKKAISNLNKLEDIKVIPRLDRDTVGVPGSPNIADTILNKIDKALLIVSDVSIINSGSKSRKMPNPNVLFELGYAIKSKGIDNVLMVQNTAYGDPSNLPFDLKMNRVITYKFLENGDNTTTKTDLSKIFEEAIKIAITKEDTKQSELSANDEFHDILSGNTSPLIFERKLKSHIDKLLKNLEKTDLYKYSTSLYFEEYDKRKKEVEKLTEGLINIFFMIGQWADQSQIDLTIRQLERLIKTPNPEGSYNDTWTKLAKYPALIIFYSFSLGAIYNKNIKALDSLFNIEIYNRFSGKNEPVISELNTLTVLYNYKELSKTKRYYPGSDELFDMFRNLFPDLSDENYEDYFDTLEYLISLKYAMWSSEEEISFWVPTGSYAWRKRRRKIWEIIFKDLDAKGQSWIYFDIFRSDEAKLRDIATKANDLINKASQHYW